MLFSAGDLDTTFGGGDGKVLTPANFEITTDAAPLPGGGWVAAGGVRVPGDRIVFGLHRYKADGSVDKSFGGGDGLATADFGALTASPSAVAVAPDGRIVVAGEGNFDPGLPDVGIVIARFNADGSPDTSFGSGGKVVENPAGRQNLGVGGVAVQPDRKIVVAGRDDESNALVARYNVNGTPDPSFGGDGHTSIDVFGPQDDYFGSSLKDVAIAADGKVVAVGTAGVGPRGTGATDVMVVRLTASGERDATFGDTAAGVSLANLFGDTTVDIGSFDTGTAVEPLRDGSILVGGNDQDGAFQDGVVLRYPANGLSPTRLDPPGLNVISDFAVMPDARVLVAGTRGGNFGLAGYRPDNSSDPAFAGADPADFGGNDVPSAIAVRPDGHVEIGGRRDGGVGAYQDFALARYVGTFTQPAGGSVTYQAESARLSGAVVAHDNAGYTGTGYADFVHSSGDFVEWTVNAPSAGKYRLTFRYANGSATDRSLELKLSGSLAKSHLSLPPTGGWAKWSTVSVDFPLHLAANTVRLTSNGFNGPNIDSLAVAPVPGSTQDRTLQAEDASVTGASISHSNAGYTGTGYVDFNHTTGDAIDWTVNLAETAQYSFEFRYANGGSTNRPLKMIISGDGPFTLQMEPTGSWSKWGLTGASTTLTAGTYHIRLEAMGFSGPNVDALIVHKV